MEVSICDQQVFVRLPIAVKRASTSGHCFHAFSAYSILQDSHHRCSRLSALLQHTETAVEVAFAETRKHQARISKLMQSQKANASLLQTRPDRSKWLSIYEALSHQETVITGLGDHLQVCSDSLRSFHDTRLLHWTWLDAGLRKFNDTMTTKRPRLTTMAIRDVPWLCHVPYPDMLIAQLRITLSRMFFLDYELEFQQYWSMVEVKGDSISDRAIRQLLRLSNYFDTVSREEL